MKYIANPVEVDAWPIEQIEQVPAGPLPGHDGRANLRLSDGFWVTATPEMLSRITPKVGDYYVVQSDGYVYLNPKEVFSRKYRRA